MNKWYKLCSSAVVLGLACLSGLQASEQHVHNPKQLHDVEHTIIRDDVILDLKIPYEKILYGEIPHIYVGIKNQGERPLQINTDFMFETWNQMLFETRGEGSTNNLTRPEIIPDWEELQEQVDSGQIGFETISKGEFRIYASDQKPRAQLSWNYDILPRGTQQMRLSLLVGEHEWAFSNWIEISRTDDLKLNELETLEVIRHGSIDLAIKQANIDGENYLFLVNRNNGKRIARLPKGASPRFEVIGENLERKLVIYFDGVDAPPVVHRIASIETLEGSAETTPHLEVLRSLEKSMSGSTSLTALNSFATTAAIETPSIPELAIEEPAEVVTLEHSEETAEKSTDWLLWLIGALVVLGALALVVRRKN